MQKLKPFTNSEFYEKEPIFIKFFYFISDFRWVLTKFSIVHKSIYIQISTPLKNKICKTHSKIRVYGLRVWWLRPPPPFKIIFTYQINCKTIDDWLPGPEIGKSLQKKALYV